MSKQPGQVPSVPVEERLFSLVLALLASENGLTKGDILSTVQGYRQRYAPGGDNASLERQFERDKDDIRELGVPLETLEDPSDPGNNQNLRYRIPKGEYDLPAEIEFTSDEIALLNLAGMAWREGSLSSESRRALLKLGSMGVDTQEPLLGLAPRIRTRDAAFAPLSEALERQVLAKFDYLTPGSAQARERTVAPLAIVQHGGRWHLYAIDTRVNESRTYLLSRIVGRVTVTRTAHDFHADNAAAVALAELDELWRTHTARVRAIPGSDADRRLRARRDTTETDDGLVIHFTDENLLADELAGYGPEVRVESPDSLVDRVIERLRRVVSVHHGSRES